MVFQPEGKRTQVEIGSTLLNAAIKAGVDLTSICGGKGTCGKCKVIIDDKHAVNNLTTKEKDVLKTEEIQKGIRLACFTEVNQDIVVKIPESSRTGKQRLQVEGIDTPVKLAPMIKKYHLELTEPTLQDSKSDMDRILEALQKTHGLSNLTVNFNLIKNLGRKLRENCSDWKGIATVWRNELIDVESAESPGRIFGYAVDIGTTKLAGYLIDINTGKVIAAGSLMNPQIPFGEDVIARLNHPDQAALQQVVCDGLNQILVELLDKTGVKAEEVYEVVAVGNTIMHHLFLGIYPLYVGRAPYPPVVRDAILVDARDHKMNINPNGKIYVLPTIAGFVGADTVGVILATEIYKRDEICLAVDIGTNTEIVLGNKDRMMTASCASGPAFEGAHIKFGMRAASGSIEKIKIIPETLEVKYETIDNEPPIGICGSGMIDIVAEMMKVGLIDVGGIFNRKFLNNRRVREKEDSIEFIVVPAKESGTKEDITFSQKDVTQIVLAKAAIHSGFKLLLKNFKITKEDVHTLFVAGAFGSHINKESARMIGIFPEFALDKIIVVGNAAGTGARMCLVSETAKALAEKISKTTQYLELGIDEDFQKVFLNSNLIPYADLDEFPEISKILKESGNYPDVPPPKF